MLIFIAALLLILVLASEAGRAILAFLLIASLGLVFVALVLSAIGVALLAVTT